MAFILGEAIAAEFRAIAALLALGGIRNTGGGGGPSGAPSPVPSPGPGSSGGSGSGSPPGGSAPPPGQPGVLVPVTSDNAFNNLPVPATPCPLFSAADYQSLLAIQARTQSSQNGGATSGVILPQGFGGPNLAIATGQLVELDDQFQFVAYSNSDAVPVSFFGRVQKANGDIIPFHYSVTTDTAGTLKTISPMTGAGVLLSASASIPVGTTLTGSVNAVGMIGKPVQGAFLAHTSLFNGQVSATQPLSSTLATPSSPVENPTFKAQTFAGTGTKTTIGTVAVTNGKRARITSVEANYTTSATAGNRQLFVEYDQGSTYVWLGLQGSYTVASTNGVLRAEVYGQTVTPGTLLPGSFQQIAIPLPPDLWFTGSMKVTASSFGPAGAGDVCGNLFISWTEI